MSARLAIDGGPPVRDRLLPYARPEVDDDDVQAVVETLRSEWLTTGPKVAEFEAAFAAATGAGDAVAVNTGTAALHAACYAAGVGAGDEVISTPITFAASTNCAIYLGATPVFADVEPDTLLIDPASVERAITPRTRAIVAVDYAGHPCDWDALRAVADRHGLALISDASHSLGATYRDRAVGTLADFTCVSLHAVKAITTGEGGMVTTEDGRAAERMRAFRSHGITTDHRARGEQMSWYYEMEDLGFNYRIPDTACALGISQLGKLPGWLSRRRAIAAQYDATFAETPAVRPLAVRPDVEHGYHLYVVRLGLDRLRVDRGQVFRALRAEGIGVNVHYIPVHLHPYYRERFGTEPGLCPARRRPTRRSSRCRSSPR
jgi:perosamine synthetase